MGSTNKCSDTQHMRLVSNSMRHLTRINITTFENLFSSNNYSIFAAAGLVIWLAHFQFGSGSGGAWLTLYLIISIIYLFVNKNSKPPITIWELLLLSLVACYFIMIVLGSLKLPSGLLGSEGLGAIDNPSRFILAIPLYFAWRRVAITVEWLLLGAVCGILVIIIPQLYLHSQGVITGTASVTGHHIIQGEIVACLGAILLIIAWIFYLRRSYALGIVALVFWFLSVVSIILSGTRGAWVATLISVFGALVLAGLDHWRTALVALLLSILLASIGILAIGTEQREAAAARVIDIVDTLEKYYEGQLLRTSPGLRLLMWKGSLQIVEENPLGTGSDSFNTEIKKLVANDDSYRFVAHHNHAHNEFINTLVENGWPGLFVLSLLFVYPAWLFLRAFVQNKLHHISDNLANIIQLRTYAGCGLMLLSSYFGSSLTQSVFSHHSTVLFFVVLLYFCCAQIRAWEYKSEAQKHK